MFQSLFGGALGYFVIWLIIVLYKKIINQILKYPTIPPIIDWSISWIKLVLKLGRKFFNKASPMIVKFRLSGIIKFSKSIKKIMIKIKLKIDKKIIVREFWKFK